jgi:pimeloyl-ACP methyl ester carboxylesterase
LDGTGLLLADFVDVLGTGVDARIVKYPPDVVMNYAELETLVRASLPTDRPFVLLGESFSGPIAMSIAADPPPNLRGAILVCTFSCVPGWSGAGLLARLIPAVKFPMARIASWALLGRFTTQKLIDTLERSMAQVSPLVRKRRLCALLDVDIRDKLPAIAVPTLILYANEDRLIPRDAADAMAKKIPQATVMEFAAPHGLLQTVSAQAAAAITQFMARCLAPR